MRRCLPTVIALGWIGTACAPETLPTDPAPSLSVTAAAAPVWTATDISPVPGNSYAWKINDGGAVVGWSNTTQGTRGWLRTSAGVVKWLTAAPGAIGSEAFGLSGNGKIVGTMLYPGGLNRAAYWNSFAANPVVMDTLPSVQTNAFGVRSTGEVIGWGLDGLSQQTAFVWRPLLGPKSVTFLQPLSGIQETQAYDINAQGTIVGTAHDGLVGQVPVRWALAGGPPVAITAAPGRAYGISPNGTWATGYLDFIGGAGATMWNLATGLGTTFPVVGTEEPIELRDVTSRGVGAGMALVGGVQTPWVVRNHPTLGYRLLLPVPTGGSTLALSINEHCRIVGWGSGTAWLWTPSQCP